MPVNRTHYICTAALNGAIFGAALLNLSASVEYACLYLHGASPRFRFQKCASEGSGITNSTATTTKYSMMPERVLPSLRTLLIL